MLALRFRVSENSRSRRKVTTNTNTYHHSCSLGCMFGGGESNGFLLIQGFYMIHIVMLASNVTYE